MPPILHLLAIHTRRRACIVDASAYLVAPLHVHIFDVEGVDVAGEVAEDGEGDIDEEVGAATCYDIDTDWWHCWVVEG